MNRFLARLAITIAALLVMIIAAVIAIGYFAYSLYLLLAQSISPAGAAVLTGVILLAIAAVLAAATQIVGKRDRPRRENDYRGLDGGAAEFGGELGRHFMRFAQTRKSASMIAALAAGFAFGVSPKLRQFLLDILKKS